MVGILRIIWLALLRGLLPAECHVCGRPISQGVLCLKCQPRHALIQDDSNLCLRCGGIFNSEGTCPRCELYPLPFESLTYLWEYGGLVRDFLCALKYRPSRSLCRLAGRLMAEELDKRPFKNWDLIVPMMASPKTLQVRGFNQCRVIAVAMRDNAFSLRSIPITEILLAMPGSKGRRSEPRARLDRMKRLRSKVEIVVKNAAGIEGKRVLLVEDVVTTGVTVNAASYALISAGAKAVDVVALARSPLWERCRARVNKLFISKEQPATNTA